VNDSYFAAMTYPAVSAFANPADIHDALWGLTSVVYGGAIHPTGEGHAAMADAALWRRRRSSGLRDGTGGRGGALIRDRPPRQPGMLALKPLQPPAWRIAPASSATPGAIEAFRTSA